MALIDQKSHPVAKQQLNLFSLPGTQVAIVRSYPLTFWPKNQMENGPIIFDIPSNPNFLDVSSNQLYIKCKITKADGSNMDCTSAGAPDMAAPINYLTNTMFSQVKIHTNGKLLYDSSDTFMYKAYLEAVLGFDRSAKKSYLKAAMYEEDQADRMDLVDTNFGATLRANAARDSRVMELIGPLHCDILNQERYFPPHVPLTFELHRNSDKLVVATDKNEEYKLKLLEIRLQLRIVETLPSLTLEFEKHLSQIGVKIPIKRSEIKVFHMHEGRIDLPSTSVHSGILPRRVIIGMLASENFHGAYKKNPFNFQAFDLKSIQLTAGGHDYPVKPMEPNFATDNFMVPFYEMHECMKGPDGRPCSLNLKQFGSGYTFFCFDLSADNSGGADYFNIRHQGTVELRMKLGTVVPAGGIKCIMYFEFDGLLTIDGARQFYLDYAL